MLVEREAMQESKKRKKGTYHQGFCRPPRLLTSPPSSCPAVRTSLRGPPEEPRKFPLMSKGRKRTGRGGNGVFLGRGVDRCGNETKNDSQRHLRVCDNFSLKAASTPTLRVQRQCPESLLEDSTQETCPCSSTSCACSVFVCMVLCSPICFQDCKY